MNSRENKISARWWVCVICLLIVPTMYCSGWQDNLSRLDWPAYQNTICLKIFQGEIVLPALGHGSVCGHQTPNCNQAYCGACAAGRGVCAVCGKKNTWLNNTDPVTEVPLLLSMLKYSQDIEAKRVAIYALGQINGKGTVKKVMSYSGDRELWMQLAMFAGETRDQKYTGFLRTVLHSARDDYFGDANSSIEKEYHLAESARAAAVSLAKIGTRKAKRVLINSALQGRLWERCYAIAALGEFKDDDVRNALHACLREFFARDGQWKWVPGRDLIGATLGALSRNGNRETALLVTGYIFDPGCDFLYEDLKKCLAAIGRPAIPQIISATQANLRKKPLDYANQILIESLGAAGDSGAVDFFITLLDTAFAEEGLERDIKNKALEGVGRLKGHKAFASVVRELQQGRDEWTRLVAARTLGQLGGQPAFDALTAKINQGDGENVIRECLTSLNAIAFIELKTDSVKLIAAKLTAQQGGQEWAFQLMQEAVSRGEPWAVPYYFELIKTVSLQHSLLNVIQLLDCPDRTVFDRTAAFLTRLTKLDNRVGFTDPDAAKTEYKQKVLNWYQKNYTTLK